MDRPRILLIDDHALMRAGLRALITESGEFVVVGEFDNGRDAIRAVLALAPNLVLIDLSMPGLNGMETIIELKRRDHALRIIVLTMHREAEYVHASLSAGAQGYVLKDASRDDLLNAIRSVLAGKSYLSPDVSGDVIATLLRKGGDGSPLPIASSLTHREREVLKLVAEGRSNRETADFLALSVKTVEKHRANLMKKLDLHNVAMLTAFAIKHGLLDNGHPTDTLDGPLQIQRDISD